MNTNNIEITLKLSIVEVVPGLLLNEISLENSLHALGANSIDRAEIIMLTMSKLKLNIPLIKFSKANNIGELIKIFKS